MSITVPPSDNYQSPLVANPARMMTPAPEGAKQIPIEIDWNAMSPVNQCMSINPQSNATLNFSQIVSLKIDNSQCGADIQIVFPDASQEVVTIPAYSPDVIVPCFAQGVHCYVLAIGTITSNDITRMQLLNYVPPPVAVPTSREQQIVSLDTVAFIPGSTQVIAADTDGTLEGLQVLLTNAAALEDFHYLGQFKDGAGRILSQFQIDLKSGNAFTGQIISWQSIALRFTGGVSLTITATIGTMSEGFLTINALYREP